MLVMALGTALFAGNGFALLQARRGRKPAGAQGELNRGRARLLAAAGLVLAVWGLATLLLS